MNVMMNAIEQTRVRTHESTRAALNDDAWHVSWISTRNMTWEATWEATWDATVDATWVAMRAAIDRAGSIP